MLYLFGAYTLDTQSRELRRADLSVHLERKVFDVLHYLLEHPKRLIAKEELLASVWPGVSVEEGAVARCIYAARRAIGDDGRGQQIIRTAHGQGYRLVAAVEVRFEDAPTPVARPSRDELESGAAHRSPPSAARSERHPGHQTATVLCGVVSAATSHRLDLDAERARAELIAGVIGDAARSHDGVVQHLGSDGFTVVFGAPVAQEDHARRAVLAALAIRDRWATAIGWGAVAIGLHTSLVAVADTAASVPHSLVLAGDAPLVAKTVARAASAGAVVITDVLQRLLHGVVQSEPLPASTPASGEEPITRHRLLRATRFDDAASPTRLERLVGHDDELTAEPAADAVALG